MSEKTDLVLPVQESKADLKDAAWILSDAIKAFKELTPLYEKIRIPGFLVLSGVVLALVTVVLIVIGNSLPTAKTTLGEEILMASLALLFVSLGVAFQTICNGMQTKLALETLKVGAEKNEMLHEETMAKLKLPSDLHPTNLYDGSDLPTKVISTG